MKDWLTRLRGKKQALIPAALWCKTITSLPFLEVLTVNEKNELKTKVEAFLAEKEFSTVGNRRDFQRGRVSEGRPHSRGATRRDCDRPEQARSRIDPLWKGLLMSESARMVARPDKLGST